MDVARFVSFAAKKEKAVAADAKNFWHAPELYSCDIGTNKDFGGQWTAATGVAADTAAATTISESSTRLPAGSRNIAAGLSLCVN